MNVFLFPYALLRVSGEYFKKIESLNFNETIFILNKRSEQLKNKELLKTQICDELYDLIPAIRENETQNLLLNLKRNIYNNRSSKEELLVKVNSHLNDNIKALLVKYEKIEKEIIIILNLYQKTFLKEFNNIQEKLFEISKSEVLKRGIILSSSSLHQQLISFLKKEFKDITNEDRKIENSLIKFITRLCTKTSPFSTFTNLAICEVKSFKYLLKESNFISINHSKKKIVHSHVKLNNTILKYILNIIFLDERIYEKIDIDLNPSLELKQNKYNYLTTTNKVDSFQSITQNEVLDVFVKLLKKEKGSISFIKLCNKIFEKEIIQASVDEIKEFVKQLIDIGFIEWRFGVSGQDPDWDINLTEKLKSLEIDLPELLDLIKSIRTLRLLSKKYEKASSNKRNLILIHSFKLLKESCENLKKKSLKVYNDKDSKTLSEDDNDFPFKPEGIFYEDTTLKIQPKINKEYLEDISYKLSLLYKELGLFEVRLKEKTKMMAYYIEKYGKHERVNLLTFYEEYYRDVKIHEQENIKEGVQKVKMTETNVFYERSVEVSIDLDKKRQLWLDMFADVINYKSISKQGSTNFTLSDFVKTNEKVLTPTNNTVSSHAAFLQFFEDNSSKDDFFAILNVSVSGFGKYFSRFLPLFNDTITKKTVVINKDHPKNIIRAENCDDSYFNANIHPPLMHMKCGFLVAKICDLHTNR